MIRGKFITFDGIDGAGKSTQIALLADYLRAQGKRVHITREPGGTDLAERIRQLLLDKDNQMTSLTELLLMFAARADHIEQLKTALADGEWVICSRFTDATIAYQGYGRGIALAQIATLAELVHGDFQPDMSLFLDLPATLAQTRRQTRGEASDRIESEALRFMQNVRQGYLAIAEQSPARCKVIDATQSIEQVNTAICQHIDTLLAEAESTTQTLSASAQHNNATTADTSHE